MIKDAILLSLAVAHQVPNVPEYRLDMRYGRHLRL